MPQQSLLGRIGQLAKANINALLDSAEDPQKMLDQMVRDYTAAIREAEESVAVTIGDLRLLEADHAEAASSAKDWGGKASAASRRADQMRGDGNAAEADRFDKLARVALERQIRAEKEAEGFEPQITSRSAVVDKLKDGLNGMRTRLEDLKRKRDELVARSRMADAQNRVNDAIGGIDLLDPTSEVSRFEDKVRREEARVAGRAELASSSLDAQFEELEDVGEQTEVELRLAALKSGTSTD